MTQPPAPGFFTNLWCVMGNYRYCQAQQEVYSLWSILCNKRKLRKDYIQYTARSYAQSVRTCRESGYMPEDHHHMSELHWFRELTVALGNASADTKETTNDTTN